MRYFIVVIAICLCMNFVLSAPNQNGPNNLEEKSHGHHDERAHQEHHSGRSHHEHHEGRSHHEHHEGRSHHEHHEGRAHHEHHEGRAHHEHHEGRAHHDHHEGRTHQDHQHGRIHHEENIHKEHERNKNLVGLKEHHHQQRSHFDHQIHYRDQENQQCSWVCKGDQNGLLNNNIQVQYKTSSALFGILNEACKQALIFAYDANITALLNGETGSLYILNHDKNQLVSLPYTPGISWVANDTSFEDYFQNLSVPNLLQAAQQNGQQFDLNKVPQTVTNSFEDNLKCLGLAVPFNEAVPMIAVFSTSLRNGLSLLYMGNGVFDIQNSIRWFLRINQFINDLIRDEGFDISNVTLNPSNIFSASSGIQVLTNLFSQLAGRINFSSFINSLVNSREKFIKLLEDLSGGSHNGIDGLATIFVHLIKASSMEEPVTELIKSILSYNSTGLEEPMIGQIIDQLLEIMRVQSRLFPMNEGTDLFIKFLEDANRNDLVTNNLHVFDIIRLFTSPNPMDRIGIIIRVLTSFMPHRSIPAFFSFVREIMSDASNSTALNQFLPGLNISSFTGNGTILRNILDGGNLTELFSSGNITSALSQIPILGDIVKRISSSLGGQNIEQIVDPLHFGSLFLNGLNNSLPGIIQAFGWLNNSSQSLEDVFDTFQRGATNLFGL